MKLQSKISIEDTTKLRQGLIRRLRSRGFGMADMEVSFIPVPDTEMPVLLVNFAAEIDVLPSNVADTIDMVRVVVAYLVDKGYTSMISAFQATICRWSEESGDFKVLRKCWMGVGALRYIEGHKQAIQTMPVERLTTGCQKLARVHVDDVSPMWQIVTWGEKLIGPAGYKEDLSLTNRKINGLEWWAGPQVGLPVKIAGTNGALLSDSDLQTDDCMKLKDVLTRHLCSAGCMVKHVLVSRKVARDGGGLCAAFVLVKDPLPSRLRHMEDAARRAIAFLVGNGHAVGCNSVTVTVNRWSEQFNCYRPLGIYQCSGEALRRLWRCRWFLVFPLSWPVFAHCGVWRFMKSSSMILSCRKQSRPVCPLPQ